jgi:hypothetical protein
MHRIIICLILFCTAAFAQTAAAPPSMELIKKDAAALQGAVNSAINEGVPGALMLYGAKASYLEGFGLLITLETSLEPTRNPFSSPKSPAEIRTSVLQRRKQMQEKLVELLKQRTGGLQSLGADGSVAIVVHIFNSNPADVPELPAQLVLTSRKQDPTNVKVSEF